MHQRIAILDRRQQPEFLHGSAHHASPDNPGLAYPSTEAPENRSELDFRDGRSSMYRGRRPDLPYPCDADNHEPRQHMGRLAVSDPRRRRDWFRTGMSHHLFYLSSPNLTVDRS